MAADTVCTLVNGHIMALAQKPCRGKPGDPGSDDCNFEAKIGEHASLLSNEALQDALSGARRPGGLWISGETTDSAVWITSCVSASR